jgi:hypothetical protein
MEYKGSCFNCDIVCLEYLSDCVKWAKAQDHYKPFQDSGALTFVEQDFFDFNPLNITDAALKTKIQTTNIIDTTACVNTNFTATLLINALKLSMFSKLLLS